MILGRGRTAMRAESVQVGCVSLSMRWFGDGRFSEAAFRAAQVAAGAELEEALEPFAPMHWQGALGPSGAAGRRSSTHPAPPPQFPCYAMRSAMPLHPPRNPEPHLLSSPAAPVLSACRHSPDGGFQARQPRLVP